MTRKPNYRPQPNCRHRFYFYQQVATTGSDGEPAQKYPLVAKGFFAKEKPRKPREGLEGDRTFSEFEQILVGQWTKALGNVTGGMIAYEPATETLYHVNGDAQVPMGDRKNVHIYIVKNVDSYITEADLLET
jgi:hypothetical protein